MEYFLHSLKKHKFMYIIVLSVIATVILFNATLDFAERVINNPILLLFSLLVFYFFVHIAVKQEVQKNEKRSD